MSDFWHSLRIESIIHIGHCLNALCTFFLLLIDPNFSPKQFCQHLVCNSDTHLSRHTWGSHLWCTAGCCSAHSSSSWRATGRAASPPCGFPRTSRRCRTPTRTAWGPERWGTETGGSGYAWTCSPTWLLLGLKEPHREMIVCRPWLWGFKIGSTWLKVKDLWTNQDAAHSIQVVSLLL